MRGIQSSMMDLLSHTKAYCSLLYVAGVLCLAASAASAFAPVEIASYSSRTPTVPLTRLNLSADKRPGANKKDSPVEEYRNLATKVLSNFMRKDEMEETSDPLTEIDFDAPKISKLPLETLAQFLDAELYESEWFVTGRVNPIYFAESFKFQDPDVKVSGIAEYAKGVTKIFDQKTARAEIISTIASLDTPNTITCKWRLSGNVSIGPGLTIKPYIVNTDFTVDPETGLIVFQQDRFDAPQWDILLSCLFPWTVGRITSPPAPPVAPRVVVKPVLTTARTLPQNPFDALSKTFSNMFS